MKKKKKERVSVDWQECVILGNTYWSNEVGNVNHGVSEVCG